MKISKTPYRISLFGGGSDHPKWFFENPGFVVSFAIDKFCYILAREFPPYFSYSFRVGYSVIEEVKDSASIKHPVVREAVRRHSNLSRLEINHHSDLPARSGVGSSSAFTVGLIHSILALEGKPISKFDLANLAIDLECNVLKENVGWQDQVACAIGGINAISFHAQSGWANKPISFQEEYRREFESKIVIAYTGVERISSNVTLGLLENLEKKKQHMYELIEMANVADSILSSQGNLDDLGILLNESWKVKRLMNNQASTSIIDSFYEEGIRCGASGGKILGAGGGGFFLFWIPSGNRERFIREFKFGPLVDITISYEGTSLIQ